MVAYNPHNGNVVNFFLMNNDDDWPKISLSLRPCPTVANCSNTLQMINSFWATVTSTDLPCAMGPWRGGATGKAFGLAISRSRVQILLEATLLNDLRQVVYTYVPLSPGSITWYRPKGGVALRLGR